MTARRNLTGQRRREAQSDLAAYAAAIRPNAWPVPPLVVVGLVALVVIAVVSALWR